MRNVLIILALTLVFLESQGQSKKDTINENEVVPANLLDDEYINVSLVRLIATPEKYDSKIFAFRI
jgi:hypothetical protein